MVVIGLRDCSGGDCLGPCLNCQCNLDVHFQNVVDLPSNQTRCGDCAAIFNNRIYSLGYSSTPGFLQPYNLCDALQRSSRYTGQGTAQSQSCLWSTAFTGCTGHPNAFFWSTVFLSVFLATYVPTGQKIIALEIFTTNQAFISNTGITSLGSWISQETVNDLDGQLDSFMCGNTYHMIPVDQGSICVPNLCDWSNTVITLTSNPV